MDAVSVIGKDGSVNQIHTKERDSLLHRITQHLVWLLSYYSYSSCSCLASGNHIVCSCLLKKVAVKEEIRKKYEYTT